jgi:hypothetical protein
MRYRSKALGAVVGGAGLAVALVHFGSPIYGSLLVGGGVGLVLSTVVRSNGEAPKGAYGIPDPEPKIRAVIAERQKKAAKEQDRLLDNFDRVLARVVKVGDPGADKEVAERFGDMVTSLSTYYPEWDSEGRMRTFVLMKKIADSIDLRTADSYLEMAYRMLASRGSEAQEMSKMTLNPALERMYRDPANEGAKRLAGTLLLANREDPEYAKEMVLDAVHLWSDAKFARMKEELATVSMLGKVQETTVLDLLEKEITKSRSAKDAKTAKRAKEVWVAIQTVDPRPEQLR